MPHQRMDLSGAKRKRVVHSDGFGAPGGGSAVAAAKASSHFVPIPAASKPAAPAPAASESAPKKKKKTKPASDASGGGGGGGGAAAASSTSAAGAEASVDDIFRSLKVQKEAAKRAVAEKGERRVARERAAAEVESEMDLLEKSGKKANRIKGSDSPVPLRIDPDSGFPVYSIEQLKIGKGSGSTELCPFDCKCCF